MVSPTLVRAVSRDHGNAAGEKSMTRPTIATISGLDDDGAPPFSRSLRKSMHSRGTHSRNARKDPCDRSTQRAGEFKCFAIIIIDRALCASRVSICTRINVLPSLHVDEERIILRVRHSLTTRSNDRFRPVTEGKKHSIANTGPAGRRGRPIETAFNGDDRIRRDDASSPTYLLAILMSLLRLS